MAGTATPGIQCINMSRGVKELRAIHWSWVADASGNVTGTGTVSELYGQIVGVEFKPSTSAVPTAYTCAIQKASGIDVLMGQCSSMSTVAETTTNIRTILNSDGGFVFLNNDSLVPAISSAGSGGSGDIYLYIEI